MDWVVGTIIDFPDSTDSRWTSSHYQGKDYFTLGAPPETQQQGGQYIAPKQDIAPVQTASDPNKDTIASIDAKIDRVLIELQNISLEILKMEDKDDIPVIQTDDIPVIQTQDSDLKMEDGTNVPF